MLNFQNAKLRESFLPVTEEGIYTVIGVAEAPKAKFPAIALQLIKDDTNTKHSMLLGLPKSMTDISPNTGLGRIIEAYDKDHNAWSGRKVEIRIDDQGKKHVYPIKEVAVSASS
jgi:hypothetical protein